MRAVIFDLDGTLADSAPDIATALNRALVEGGFAPFDLAQTKSMVGAGARKLVERALAAREQTGDEALTEVIHRRFLAHYHANPCVETRLYPGVRASLQTLAERGWRLGVCTNKPEDLARVVVEDLEIGSLFQAIVGGRNGVALKPSPDMVLAALRELGTCAEQTVFVGDSAADVGAAKAANLAVIAVSHGYGAMAAEELGANAVITHFDQLASACDRVIKAP